MPTGSRRYEQLTAAGVVGAARIVERRKPSRQLRLGAAKIAIDIV